MNSLVKIFAANTNTINNLSCVGGSCNDANIGGKFENTFFTIINWIMGIIGLVCVIVVIVGGVQYMTSTGDPGKVKKAKDTILYGVIGLIIVALSAAIVNFVIKGIIGA